MLNSTGSLWILWADREMWMAERSFWSTLHHGGRCLVWKIHQRFWNMNSFAASSCVHQDLRCFSRSSIQWWGQNQLWRSHDSVWWENLESHPVDLHTNIFSETQVCRGARRWCAADPTEMRWQISCAWHWKYRKWSSRAAHEDEQHLLWSLSGPADWDSEKERSATMIYLRWEKPQHAQVILVM